VLVLALDLVKLSRTRDEYEEENDEGKNGRCTAHGTT
jgi:hypothetical protein